MLYKWMLTGQHNISDLPIFYYSREKEQESLICGFPIYDHSVSETPLLLPVI